MTKANVAKGHREEIASGERFTFGENWARFLETLDKSRIDDAVNSLRAMLEVDDLRTKSFLDVGSGSGLFSLAARQLGANVVSFDYDPQSVECARELKRRYFPDDLNWKIEEGSVLDSAYLESLGKFDFVYSWGVLHHTGAMWNALSNVDCNVAENGKLFIALYNDHGASRRWSIIKRTYNKLPKGLKFPFAVCVYAPIELQGLIGQLIRGRPFAYFSNIKNYNKRSRGMSWWYDRVDWLGGYPYEVSKPEHIFEFYKGLGYKLTKLATAAGGHGCNEFVFMREGGVFLRSGRALI